MSVFTQPCSSTGKSLNTASIFRIAARLCNVAEWWERDAGQAETCLSPGLAPE